MKTGEHMKSWSIVFRDFECKYPHIFDQAVDWYPYSDTKIVVILEDKTKYIYNYITQRIYRLHPDNEFARCNDDSEWMMLFARTLKEKMMRRFIGQNELCEMTGISRISMSKYMNGKAIPNIRNLFKIATVLDCPIEELTGEV